MKFQVSILGFSVIYSLLIVQVAGSNLCGLQHFCECPPHLLPAKPGHLHFSKHSYNKQYGLVGQAKELHCCVGPFVTELIWFKDGERFPWDKNRHAILYSKNQSLIILNVREEDAGEYECKVRFGDEKISFTTRLSSFPSPVFAHRPIWKDTPKTLEFVVGETALLSCSGMVGQQYNTVSLEPVQATWIRKNEEIVTGHRFNVTQTWQDDDIVLNLSLEISDVEKEDTGEYTCRMENKYGSIEHKIQMNIVEKQKGVKDDNELKLELDQILESQKEVLTKLARFSSLHENKKDQLFQWIEEDSCK